MTNVENKIDNAIDKLIYDFECYPNKYLTEEDVRVQLCMFLMSDFGRTERTKDDDYSISLHSEIRWYGPSKLKYRSDIVIFEVSDLCVTPHVISDKNKFRLIPKKGYSANRPLAIIELKLRRNTGGSNRKFLKQVDDDIKKLNKINNMLESGYAHKAICRVIALDKREEITLRPSYDDPKLLKYSFANISKKKPCWMIRDSNIHLSNS